MCSDDEVFPRKIYVKATHCVRATYETDPSSLNCLCQGARCLPLAVAVQSCLSSLAAPCCVEGMQWQPITATWASLEVRQRCQGGRAII